MLTLKNIRKIYGTRRVLERVSFSIGAGQKVALVGPNGVGKSTLLKIIAGLETPDRGEVILPRRVLRGYLGQEGEAESQETLFAYLRRMAGLNGLEEEMQGLEQKLGDKKELERYEALENEYRRLGGYHFLKRAKKILEGLRLSEIALDRPITELSGGEKRKTAVAGVLLRGVDFLLLDEPTNNLDLPALLWLERYLNCSAATVLMASHDRQFLDNVVTKVLELDWQKREAVMYVGGWSDYERMRAHRLRKQKELYRTQEEEKQRLLASQREKMDWADKTQEKKAPDRDKLASHYKKERAIKKFTRTAKAVEGRMKRLNTVEKPSERMPLVFHLPAAKESSFIELHRVRFGYPQGAIFGPVSLKISLGERLAFLGLNGAGKTTLLKTIGGELPPLSGEIKRSRSVRFGNLLQEHEDIPRGLTALELFQKKLGWGEREKVFLALRQFQFAPEALDTRVEDFSPGERVRLILALLAAQDSTVLVLDEPTNHLDLEAIMALETALETFSGTILIVTHDRQFLKRVRLDRFYEVKDGAVAALREYSAYLASQAALAKKSER